VTTAEGVRHLREALATIGRHPGTPHQRLQAAWTDHVHHVWEAPHVERELAERFRALWERWTGPGDDPHRTNLRAMTDGEVDAAVAELVDLALDVAAARAVETAGSAPVPGQVSYLQIPALDAAASAHFYAEVFGWHFFAAYPASFEAPGGVSGALHVDLPVAPDGGPVLWLLADDVDETLRRAVARGGRVVQPVRAQGPRLEATLTDPAGNLLGVWQAAR
jgi:predicted enzyme related to lactoylglutathione lyase